MRIAIPVLGCDCSCCYPFNYVLLLVVRNELKEFFPANPSRNGEELIYFLSENSPGEPSVKYECRHCSRLVETGSQAYGATV